MFVLIHFGSASNFVGTPIRVPADDLNRILTKPGLYPNEFLIYDGS